MNNLNTKTVTKGMCRCGCNRTAEELNAAAEKPKWVTITEGVQNHVNIFYPHFMKNAFGEALNDKTKVKADGGVHSHEITITAKITAMDARKISLALRQGLWFTKFDAKRARLTVDGTVKGRQVKAFTTAVKLLDSYNAEYTLNGEKMSALEINERISRIDSRNLHGEESEINRVLNNK